MTAIAPRASVWQSMESTFARFLWLLWLESDAALSYRDRDVCELMIEAGWVAEKS